MHDLRAWCVVVCCVLRVAGCGLHESDCQKGKRDSPLAPADKALVDAGTGGASPRNTTVDYCKPLCARLYATVQDRASPHTADRQQQHAPRTSKRTCRSTALVNLGLISFAIVALMAAAAGPHGVGGSSDCGEETETEWKAGAGGKSRAVQHA